MNRDYNNVFGFFKFVYVKDIKGFINMDSRLLLEDYVRELFKS